MRALTRFQAASPAENTEDQPEYVSHVAYTPKGDRLVLGTSGGEVLLCDGTDGTVQRRLPKLPRYVSSLDVGPKGGSLLTVAGGEARLWDLATGTERHRLEVGFLSALHFVPDGRSFAECDSTRVVRFLDRKSGAVTHRFGRSEPHDHQRQNLMTPTSIAFSPDGQRMAMARWDQAVYVWELSSGAKVATLPGRLAVQWSPDGRIIAAATGTISKRASRTALRLRLFDAATWQELRTVAEHEPENARFSPDSSLIATVGDGEIRLWDVARGTLAARVRHPEHVPITVALAPNGRDLATGGRDGDVVLWRMGGPRSSP